MKPPVEDSPYIKWEYFVLNCRGQSNEIDQEQMNMCGEQGWELVSMSQGIAYFKRIKL